MDTHVKVLGILNIVGGIIGVLGAFVVMLAFGVPVGAVAADGDADAAIAIPIIALTGAALISVILLVSIPGIVIGWGLYRFRPWARAAGIVLALLSLIIVPYGTIVGAYGLWVLLSKNTAPLFAQTQAG